MFWSVNLVLTTENADRNVTKTSLRGQNKVFLLLFLLSPHWGLLRVRLFDWVHVEHPARARLGEL